jgi:hypothetical protein
MSKTNEVFKRGKNIETLIPTLNKPFKLKDHEKHEIMA